MEEQGLVPDIDDGLDGVNPPFVFSDDEVAGTPQKLVETPPQPLAVEEEEAESDAAPVEEPLIVGTRRQPPAPNVVVTPPQPEDVDEDESDSDDDAPPPPVANPVREPRVVGTRRRPPAPVAEAEYTPEPASGGMGCADLVTAIFLLMTVGVCAFTSLLIIYPRSSLNPFPAPTFPPLWVLPTDSPTNTPTNTFTPLPASDTPTATATFTPTATFTATWTPSPTFTPVVGGLPSATITPTIQAALPLPQFTLSPYAFTVDPLRYIANSGPDGCNWQSIVVITKDLTGKPLKSVAFQVMGSSGNIDEVDYTGNVPRFGDGSFELVLGTVPRQDQFTIQLLSRNGQQISDTVTVATHTDCKQNVVVVTFVQNHEY